MKEFKIAQFEDDPGDSLTVKTIVKSLKANYDLNILLTQFSDPLELRKNLSEDAKYDLLIVDMYLDVAQQSVGEDIISDNERNNKIPTIIFTQGAVKGTRTDFDRLFKNYSCLMEPLLIKGAGNKLAETLLSIINQTTPQIQSDSGNKYPLIKYAIITALYDDEFEEVKKVFNFPNDEKIKIGNKTYYIGYLIDNPKIKVVAGVPFNTGMVDASIMATQMIEVFKPEFILMSGVCGGYIDDCNLGDIVVARNVYTFQKGKLSDIKKKNEDGILENIELFDKDNNRVDYTKLFDKDGNQIAISVEHFKIEHDSIITIDHFQDSYNEHKKSIINTINIKIKEDFPIDLKYDIKLHYEPMACSTMVINKDGFFDDTLKTIDRKTLAVEMESYGVARACKYANEGKTKPIIFKSIMDFTFNKSDSDGKIDWKKFAAYTSAQFMKHLFVNKII